MSWPVWLLAVGVIMLLRLDCVSEIEMFQVTDGKNEFIFKCICSKTGINYTRVASAGSILSA